MSSPNIQMDQIRDEKLMALQCQLQSAPWSLSEAPVSRKISSEFFPSICGTGPASDHPKNPEV